MKWVPEDEEGKLKGEIRRWSHEQELGRGRKRRFVLIYTKDGTLYEGRQEWNPRLGAWVFVSRLAEIRRGIKEEEAEKLALEMIETAKRVRFKVGGDEDKKS
ncbi:MAG: hypothetical protein QXY39_06045 [Thermofilaceae archaeon]